MTDILSRPDLTESNLKGLVADSLKAGVRAQGIEWPTIALAAFIYVVWLLTTWHFGSLPLFLSLPVLAIFSMWQSSLQHEILHGHPTPSRRVNRWLGMPPLLLWLPYDRYRQTHLTHHIDERLTDPIDDPESYYLTRDDFRQRSGLAKLLLGAQTTLLGRVTIGPYWSAFHFLLDEFNRVIRNEADSRRIWAEHALWLVIILVWLVGICGIPLWLYIIGVAMPGTGLMMVRSFAEHRAKPEEEHRTAIVENSWFFGPLFLFNNLHVVHHAMPVMPWYRIPGWYRANREAVLKANGGLVYNSYFDVARRFLIWPHDTPDHPLDRIPRK